MAGQLDKRSYQGGNAYSEVVPENDRQVQIKFVSILPLPLHTDLLRMQDAVGQRLWYPWYRMWYLPGVVPQRLRGHSGSVYWRTTQCPIYLPWVSQMRYAVYCCITISCYVCTTNFMPISFDLHCSSNVFIGKFPVKTQEIWSIV